MSEGLQRLAPTPTANPLSSPAECVPSRSTTVIETSEDRRMQAKHPQTKSPILRHPAPHRRARHLELPSPSDD
jgi:hypothetical protein